MKLTIEQIKTIIKAAEKIENKKDNKEMSELVKLFLDKVFDQTKIKNLKDLKKILVLYDSYKENDWFKQGIEKVLLEGEFPYNIIEKTIIKENPISWPTPTFPQQPYIWYDNRTLKEILEPKFDIYCNVNDESYKKLEDLLLK